MTLLASKAASYATSASGNLPAEVSDLDVVNHAGLWLLSSRKWHFMLRPSVVLSVRPSISITAGSLDAAGTTLTSGTDFSAYTYVEGDDVEITGGTSTTQGTYRVTATNGSSTITLATSASTSSPTDVTGTMKNWRAALPSDFGELVGYDATESLVNSLTLTDVAHLNALRTNQIEVSSWNFWGAIVWSEPQPDGAPSPILELWPAPASADANALTIFYRARWVDVTNDNTEIRIPWYMEPLFLQVCREFALGYTEYDNATLSARILDLQSGPVYGAAVEEDGRVQPDMGVMMGGMILSQPTSVDRWLRTTVQGPS